MHNFNRTCLIFGEVFLMMSCSGGDDSDGSSSSSSSSSSGGGGEAEGCPYTVLSSTCDGVDPISEMQVGYESAEDYNGDRDSRREITTYDADGNVLSKATDSQPNGTWKDTTVWTYDSDGNMLSRGVISDCSETVDTGETWTYDSAGNMLSHETPAWGSNSPYKYTYTYNAENQMLTEVFDYDGTMNYTTTWTYETGFSARKLSETKTGHAEAVTAKTTWSYDDVAQCKGISDIAVTDTSAPCTDDLTQAECTGTCFWMEGTITWKSDDDDDINLNTGEYSQKVYYHMNTLTQLLEGSDSINTGMQYTFNPSSWVMYTYDAPAGKTLTKAKYARSDWTLKGKTTWTYDSAGNVLTEEIDEDADGTAEETQAWTYDSDGNMLSHNATYPNYTVTESWTYDSSGNKLTHTYADSSSTGTETDTWSYACQ